MDKATAKGLLSYGPGRLRGECDRCRRDGLALYEYDEPGSWAYCERCLKVYAGYMRKVGSWRVNAEGTVVGV